MKLKIGSVVTALLSLSLVLISFLSFVQVWSFTSEDYLPVSPLEHQVKSESLNGAVVDRRANGVCPVTIDPTEAQISVEDTFAFGCFFSTTTQSSQE